MRFNLAFALTLVVAATAGSLRLRLRCGNDCNCLNNQGARDDTITVRCCTTGELSDGDYICEFLSVLDTPRFGRCCEHHDGGSYECGELYCP